MADPILREFGGSISCPGPVIDVGAGQGRNALLLARSGLAVEALEPSAGAAATLEAKARAEALPLSVRTLGFERFSLPPGTSASAVLLLGLLPILTWPDIEKLVAAVASWTSPGSVLFVTAFGVDEPSHPRIRREWRPIGRNSWERPDGGDRRTFLETGEILELFGPHEVLHHHEGLGPLHRHGGGPEHQHAMVEAVLRRL